MIKLTAVEAMGMIQRMLSSDVPDEELMSLDQIVTAYELQVEETKIEASKVTAKQMDDLLLNKVALDHGMTMNQLVGFMDMCEDLNKRHLNSSGVCAVPFWFHEQYIALQKDNKALIVETDNLMQTLALVKNSKSLEQAQSFKLPERSSILSGNTVPYIPGDTGPRIGDEHLDADNKY